MTAKIAFDPTAPYGKVCGLSTEYPGAKYQQGPYIFDIHRKCLNPDLVVEEKTEVESATAELTKKTASEAEKALEKLEAASKRMEIDDSPQAKGAYTKAYKTYKAAQDKLDKLTGA
jgi:hypothetical protein